MILLIDNYDSFSYNLYQYVGEIEPDVKVIRNDEMTIQEIRDLEPERIIISPGPGRPENAGMTVEAVKCLGENIPILGVCLGHQAVCRAYGGEIIHAGKLMHGKQSECSINTGCPIFQGLKETEVVARYHSLAVKEDTLPECLEITARADDGEIMGVKHRDYNVYGVQFHPESIMTPSGRKILKNYIKGDLNND